MGRKGKIARAKEALVWEKGHPSKLQDAEPTWAGCISCDLPLKTVLMGISQCGGALGDYAWVQGRRIMQPMVWE